MYCKTARIALLILAAGSILSCTKPPDYHRIAVLRFENLSTGAQATEDDWLGRAISEDIAGELEGTRHHAVIPFRTLTRFNSALGPRPPTSPGVSVEHAAALAAGANRLLTGTYSLRDGKLMIFASEENVDKLSQKTYQAAGTLDDLLHLTTTIAQAIDDEARPSITGSPRALRSYALGLESAPAPARPLFEEAIRLDPDFGPAYVALAQLSIAARDSDGFARIFAAVRARGNGVRAVDRALLNLDDARLHAPPAARIDALGALVKQEPADPFRLQELAVAEFESNRSTEAADHFRKLIALLPPSPEQQNQLAYALLYAGDEPGAQKAFADYRAAYPGDANAIDSSADAQFFFGHFAEAEKLYRDAYGKDPSMAEGTEPLKAAWTHLMRHDTKGAMDLVAQYQGDRGKRSDPLAPLRAGLMYRLTGDKARATMLLESSSTSNNPALRGACLTQLAWWHYFDGTGPMPTGNPKLGQAIEALTRRDNAAAIPLWRKLAQDSPPRDWWTRLVYSRVLHSSGQTQEAARFSKFTPLPQPTRPIGFDELWYPWILEVRKQENHLLK